MLVVLNLLCLVMVLHGSEASLCTEHSYAEMGGGRGVDEWSRARGTSYLQTRSINQIPLYALLYRTVL